MTTEELKVKISVDTTGLKQDIDRAKKQLSSLGDEKSTKKLGSNFGMAAEAAEELHDTLDSFRNLSFAGMIAEISKIPEQFNRFKEYKKDYKEMVDTAKAFLDSNSWVYKGPEAALDWEGEDAALENYNLHMKEANDISKEGTGIFGALFDVVGKGGGTLVAFVAVVGAAVAAIAGLVASVKNAINVAKQMKAEFAEAKNIGLDLATYQEWAYVLKSVGIEADKLSDFLKTLADEQNAVREGSEDIIAAFNKIGLSADEVSNMGQGELFEKTVLGLQNIESEVERTSIAYKIFGEDAANLTSVIAMNNEQLKALTNNFYLLGGAASDSLIEKSNTLQYSIQNLSTAWQGLKNTLAEVFMPAINWVVEKLTKAIAIVNMFVRALFGFDIIAKSTKSTSAATSGIGGYTDSVKNATAAVEKLKRTTMGFDELNIVSAPTTSGGSGAGSTGLSGGGIGGGLGDLTSGIKDLDLEGWAEKIEKFKDTIRLIVPVAMTVIGVIGCVLAIMSANWAAAAVFAGMAGIGIAIGVKNGAWKDIFTEFGKIVKEGWEKLKSIVKNGWEALGKAIFGDEGWGKVRTWFNEKVKPVFTKEFWAVLFAKIIQSVIDKMTEIRTKFNDGWNKVKEWFKTNVGKYFTKEYWLTLFGKMVLASSERTLELKNKFNEGWTNIKNWFSTNVGKYFTKQYWVDKFDSVRQGAASLKDKITTTFNGVGSKVGEAVSGAVKGAINGIFSSIENKVNSFINMINSAIGAINKIPGVNIKTLSKIYIPRLATGGITTGSTLAEIGENGREAVLPLENNTGWMDTLADRIASRSAAPSKIVLTVDGRELGWASINGINGITKQTGGLQLQLV